MGIIFFNPDFQNILSCHYVCFKHGFQNWRKASKFGYKSWKIFAHHSFSFSHFYIKSFCTVFPRFMSHSNLVYYQSQLKFLFPHNGLSYFENDWSPTNCKVFFIMSIIAIYLMYILIFPSIVFMSRIIRSMSSFVDALLACALGGSVLILAMLAVFA